MNPPLGRLLIPGSGYVICVGNAPPLESMLHLAAQKRQRKAALLCVIDETTQDAATTCSGYACLSPKHLQSGCLGTRTDMMIKRKA